MAGVVDSAVHANSTADVVAVAKFKTTDVVAMSGSKAAAANVVVRRSKVAVDRGAPRRSKVAVGSGPARRSKVAVDSGPVRNKVEADSGAVVAVKSTEQRRDRKNSLADCAHVVTLPMDCARPAPAPVARRQAVATAAVSASCATARPKGAASPREPRM
jgi:hypothetical protein